MSTEVTRAAGPEAIRLGAIVQSKTNPRRSVDKTADAELLDSVRKHGVLQPVLVRRAAEVGEYELVAGQRRFRAAKAAGLAEIPALVLKLTDDQVLEAQVIENLQRADLHPLEEADGYRRLVAAKYDVARIAERVGRSVAYVYDRLKLANLIDGARALFLGGKIQAGHAIVLARLKPEDQKRAISTHGALFEEERTLFDPTAEDEGRGEDLPEDVRDLDDDIDLSCSKTRTVRELQAWIDEHVKFDALTEDPMLFPDTVQAVTRAVEDAEKVVQITHEHFVQPCAKDGTRIHGPQTWRRADPPCGHSVTGVIVVGPGRGQAFPVCVDKKRCEVHWKDEIRARKKAEKTATTEGARSGKTGADKYALERQKREEQQRREAAERARWQKATPAILKAVAAAVEKASAPARGLLGDLVVGACEGYRSRAKGALVGRGTSAECLVRHAAYLVIAGQAGEWNAAVEFPKLAKRLGVDVAKILADVAPAPAAEKASKPKKAKRSKGKAA